MAVKGKQNGWLQQKIDHRKIIASVSISMPGFGIYDHIIALGKLLRFGPTVGKHQDLIGSSQRYVSHFHAIMGMKCAKVTVADGGLEIRRQNDLLIVKITVQYRHKITSEALI